MNKCGIRRRSLLTALFSLSALALTAVIGVQGLSGCGSASNTYSPTVKTGGVTPSFTIAVSPASVSVIAGNTANYTVNITETGGFSSPITLTASGLPTGATATFGEQTATASGLTASLAITTTAEVAAADEIAGSKLAKLKSQPALTRLTGTGNTTFTVTAVGGGITQTGTAVISITGAPDFSVTLAPVSASSNIVAPGGTATFIATVTSFGSFSTPVTLSLGGNPSNTSVAFGSTTVTPTVAGATTTLSVVTSDNEGGVTTQGSYPLTLTGTAGSLTNTGTSTLGVGSFMLTVTNASAGSGTVTQGGTAQYIITLTSKFGFAPLVTLTKPALPSGCTATFGSGTLTPTTAGATTTLTITTTASTSPISPPGFGFDVGAQGGGWDTDATGFLIVNSDEEG